MPTPSPSLGASQMSSEAPPSFTEQQGTTIQRASEKAVGFEIDRDAQQLLFSKWLQESVFAPSNAIAKIQTDKLVAVWSPAYVFRCDIISHWLGEYSQEHHTVEVSALGAFSNAVFSNSSKNQEIPLTNKTYKVWFKHQGDHTASYAYTISACHILPQQSLESIWPYKYEKTTDWSAAALGTVKREEVTIDGEQAWKLAHTYIINAEKAELLAKKITEKVLDLQTEVIKRAIELVYLPLWLLEYSYEGQQFRAFVNGQTGKITGTKPVDSNRQLVFWLVIIASVIACIFIWAALSQSR
jgi:hypothetical protein